MKKKLIFLFCIAISIFNCSADNLSEMKKVTAVFKELAYYFDASIKFYAALQTFAKNNKDPLEIRCKFCPNRALLCDELIVKIQAKAIDSAVEASDDIVHKTHTRMLGIYTTITRLLCSASLDEIKKFMVKVAHDDSIPCEECQKTEW